MICEECQQRPATVRFMKVLNGEKTEVHLCEVCSHEKSGLLMKNHGESFSIHNLLSGLLNVNSGFPSNQHSPRVNKGAVECPNCHMTYEEFVQIGKFGCAECYKTFSSQLEPIVRRLHSGNAAHTGKIPGRIAGGINLRKQIDELRAELQKCIQKEEFEKAVTLRDEIRKLESEYHTPAEGSDS